MSSHRASDPYRNISRDGFEAGFDRFYAMPGRVERVDGDVLQRMFVPKQTASAQARLREDSYFVEGQLKHYGIQATPGDLTGTGSKFLKKQILAGKCDKVPNHIENLRKQMTEEWWDKLPPNLLASQSPSRFVKRYFLNSSGAPDLTKTPEPMVLHGMYGKTEFRTAINSVPGLCFRESGYSPDVTFFVGWSKSAVDKAIRGEAEAKEEAEEEQRRERQKEHEDYVRKSRSKKTSLVGQYIIECDYIDNEWPDDNDGEMGMSVQETDEPGIYEASVDLRVFEGAMLLGENRLKLRDYAEAQSDNEDEDEDDRDDYDSEDDTKLTIGNTGKRKGAPQVQRGRPSKKSHASARKTPLNFCLLLRGRETGEGMICYRPESGSMQADSPRLVSFTGKIDIPLIGGNVAFKALKVSDSPGSWESSWAEFSESNYERERVDRWH